MPKPTQAALALESSDTESATFTATYEGKHNDKPYKLWVALNGYDTGGTHRSSSFAGIPWDTQEPVPDGTTVTLTLPKNNWDTTNPSVTFKAFVVEYPDLFDPVSNTVGFSA